SYSTTGWTKSNVVVTANCSDSQSGIVSSKVTKTVSSNGSGSLTCTDKAGNTKAVSYNVANIDKTMPSASISYSTTGWTKNNVVITANCSDSQSEIVSSKVTKTVSSNGSGSLTCTDKAGNTKAVSYNVANIDKVIPNNFTLSPNSGFIGNKDNITIPKPGDTGGSGFYRFRYRISVNGSSSSYGSWSGYYTNATNITISTIGTYYIQVEAFDKAGNVRTVRSGQYSVFDSTSGSLYYLLRRRR
ncbi:MAG: hypothetical protein ACK5HL_04575, partial [Bacilli bacterium]